MDELSAESGSNAKMDILRKYKDNKLLVDVIYKATSKKVKFYIKQIPEYTFKSASLSLPSVLEELSRISDREITGLAATLYLESLLKNLDPDDAYVIERVIQKDLKIGMGTTNINKVIPGLIEKTPYMGAKPHSDALVDRLFESGTVISDVKMDGRYCNAIIRSGEVELESRQGEPTYVGRALFLRHLSKLPDCVLNGELTVIGMERYEANGVIASIIDIEKKRESRTGLQTQKKIDAFTVKHGSYDIMLSRIVFTVWDTITIDEYFNKFSDELYSSRKLSLHTYIQEMYKDDPQRNYQRVFLVEAKVVKSKSEAISHFKEVVDRGLEGTILKSASGKWKDGKPTWQIKMKLEINLDLKIVGFQYGSKGTKNENVISTLLCETSCGELKTNPSGMDESMMEYVTENQDNLLGSIVEIRCCGLSQNSKGEWSTLHPSVVKLRDDKDTCDSLDSAREIEGAAKSLN